MHLFLLVTINAHRPTCYQFGFLSALSKSGGGRGCQVVRDFDTKSPGGTRSKEKGWETLVLLRLIISRKTETSRYRESRETVDWHVHVLPLDLGNSILCIFNCS